MNDVAVLRIKKTIKKRLINNDCAVILAPSDYMAVKSIANRYDNGFWLENLAC